MFYPEMVPIITLFAGIFVAGLIVLVLIARLSGFTGKRIDHRKEFFRLVEAAREAEILEKKPVDYDMHGEWKGQSDGYFGIGRDLRIELEQNQSELNGKLYDQFGYSIIRGFFVWPYLWFDFERHGTVFEFRGIVKELPDGAKIDGKYRYFHQDADWSVKRTGIPRPKVAPVAIPEVSGEGDSASQEDATAGDAHPSKEVQQVPTEDASGETRPSYQRGAAGKCPDCGADFEEIISFCIYCGKKKELP